MWKSVPSRTVAVFLCFASLIRAAEYLVGGEFGTLIVEDTGKNRRCGRGPAGPLVSGLWIGIECGVNVETVGFAPPRG